MISESALSSSTTCGAPTNGRQRTATAAFGGSSTPISTPWIMITSPSCSGAPASGGERGSLYVSAGSWARTSRQGQHDPSAPRPGLSERGARRASPLPQRGGPNPGTKARTRGVAELARTARTGRSEALEGGAECVGTSGFTTREDILRSLPVPMSLLQQGGPPREALSFLCATANVCVPSSEGRVAEPMGYPIIDRGLRHDRGSRRRACREGRARNRLHRERLVGGKEDRGEEAS